MEKEKYMQLVPKKISKDTKEWIEESVFNKSRYIFVKNEGGKHLGYCTSCKKEYECNYYEHNSVEYCVKCRKKSNVKLTRYGRKSLIDERTVLIYQKANKEDALVARGFLLRRDFSEDYKKTETKYLELAVYVFREKESKMFCNLSYWDWKCKDRRKEFYETSSIFSFNINGLKNIRYSVDYEGLKDAVRDNKFKYSLWEKHMGTDLLKYFTVYNKYPIIESLQKIGLNSIVQYKLDGRSLSNQVNWRGKTICDLLKLNKGQIRDIQESGVLVTPEFLKLYRTNYKESYKLTNTELKDIERILSHYYSGDTILKYANMKKMYGYVTRQYEIGDGRYSTYQEVVRMWLDYIKDCNELGLDIENKKILFTKNLFDQHLNYQKQIQYKKDEELDRLIKQNQKEREGMYFKFKGLEMRAATSTTEIIEEGKALGHCVGRYADKHAKGIITILFIRKNNEPDTSFYTVEISAGNICQVRGKKNERADERIEEFIEMYKQQKLNIKIKKVA
ncbi:MAG: PcfJ domain-containing protein [Clostridium sp.]